jgi:hypothetical protein
MWPREDARQVTGRGGSAEGRARRWWSGGGRGSSDSSDRVARLDQQATWGAFVMHEEELRGLWGVRASTRGRFAQGGANGGRRGSVADARVREEGRERVFVDAGGRLGGLRVNHVAGACAA